MNLFKNAPWEPGIIFHYVRATQRQLSYKYEISSEPQSLIHSADGINEATLRYSGALLMARQKTNSKRTHKLWKLSLKCFLKSW